MVQPSRERELVLQCCASARSLDAPARLAVLLESGIEWNLFIRLVAQNGVVPMAGARLLADFRSELPATVERQLTLACEANALRCRYQAASLLEILHSFTRERIPALAIKGAVLAAIAFGDLNLRASGDLDVLVHRTDLPRAAAVLERIGYVAGSYRAEAFASGFFPDTALDFARDGIVLDLHWRLSPSYFQFAPDGEQIWERAVDVEVGGRRVRTLGPDDSILFQAFHGSKHGWTKLRYVCDLGCVISATAAHAAAADKNDPIGWDGLIEQARRTRSLTMLLLGVELAHSMLSVEVPATVLETAARDARVVSLSAYVKRRMFDLRDEGPFDDWPIALGSIDSVRGRARYLIDRILTPKLSDSELLRLPRPLYPLYYAARPVLVAIKHGRRLFYSSRA
ncbi:MAG TPA: nucleotidyltransferase family protein [Candidatus Binataceae bacterium]